MSKFFVLFALLVAVVSSKRQKLSLAPHAAASNVDAVHIEFAGDYSAHGGKHYASASELTSLAHTSAIQAKTAVQNQQTAGLQAALGAQSGYARAAIEAASAAQVALVAKQVIVQNLQKQIDDVSHQVAAEEAQYQQALQAANAAQIAAQQSQQQLQAASAAFAAVQQSVQHSERAAAASAQAAAAQHDMIEEAKLRLGKLHSQLQAAIGGLRDTHFSAQKAVAAAKQAQNAAAVSAQLTVISGAASNQIDGHHSDYHHSK